MTKKPKPRMDKVSNGNSPYAISTEYKKIKSLAAYIDRIGAEQKTFNRFMICEYKGHYYKEKSIIRIGDDGTVYTKKEFAPTEEEAARLKEEIPKHAATWPKYIQARSLHNLDKYTNAKKEDIFEFYDRATGLIIMVQERRLNRKIGKKYYVPWTMYSDGKWRSMEPEGKLPFWKPKKKLKAKIMIHEGGKPARYCDWLVNSSDPEAEKLRKEHPWGKILCEYEHWGMIGGALAPGRTDYAQLSKEKALEYVYICDNDDDGKGAIKTISHLFGQSLKAVKFDSRWPTTWDLADPLTADNCPELFSEAGYKGPMLDKLMVSATWATDVVKKKEGKGRPSIVLRKAFIDEWSHCVRPEVFIHCDRPNVELSSTEFNSTVDPFSDSKDTASLLKKEDISKGNILAYDPSRKPGNYVLKNGERYINTHVPTLIEPMRGDVGPWLNYIESLIPEKEERHELLKWCATLIAKPSIKMHYGVLLISETQGVGKSTLGEKILIPLMGEWNTSSPSEKDVVESAFNDWCAQKRLAVVHEIYSGQSAKAYNTLKSIITDKYISVNRKFMPGFTIENWLHVFACSNSLRAIKLSSDDRRWFVPKVNEEKRTPKFWKEFNSWLENEKGLEKIYQWFIDFIERHGHVSKGEDAPWTKVKQDVVEEGMSPGQLLVCDVLDAIRPKGKIYITDYDLQDFIRNRLHEGRNSNHLEKPLTIRKIAKAKGWHIGEKRHNQLIDQTMIQGRIIAPTADIAKRPIEEMEKIGAKHFVLSSLGQKL